jgi:antitoxin component of MazEF toxin-antitoxin module
VHTKERGMLKKLVQHGNSKALVIDKSILQAAGIDEDKAVFQITINPTEGIIIKTIEPMEKEVEDESCEEVFKRMLKKSDGLMKRLANR